MGPGNRSRKRNKSDIWVPDCEDQFRTLRALTGPSPERNARGGEEHDPEFEAWLEAFPLD